MSELLFQLWKEVYVNYLKEYEDHVNAQKHADEAIRRALESDRKYVAEFPQ